MLAARQLEETFTLSQYYLVLFFYTDAQGISSTPSDMFFSTDIANYFKF